MRATGIVRRMDELGRVVIPKELRRTMRIREGEELEVLTSDENELILRNRLRDARSEKKLSQAQLAQMVGVSRNTISSIETGQFNPTAKLALLLCIALDKTFEELFYFD